MERLLHYVWKYKLYASTPLTTTEGLPIAVIDPGIQNTDAGPDFFNAKRREEIVFTRGATEALNLLAYGLEADFHSGDEIVVSALEHHANLLPWQQAARQSGAVLRILRPDAQGRLHVADLQALLSPRTRVLALTASANATGERPPYEALLAQAALAMDIMDRNLYERANDCRWWALTPDFRRILSQPSISRGELSKLESILEYINSFLIQPKHIRFMLSKTL